MGGMGCFMIPYIISAEITTPKYIVPLTLSASIGFIIGGLVMDLEAFFIRDWVPLTLVSYLPMMLGAVIVILVPESPRWLLSKNRMAEARQGIRSR